MGKLTERSIERLVCPEGRKDLLVFDSEQRGLGVRVSSAGGKTYLAQYSLAGRKHRVPLGSVDAVSLADARAAARVVMGRVAKGSDPAADRKAAAKATKVAAQLERMTVSRLVEDWAQLHLVHRSRNYRIYAKSALKRHLSDWWNKPADRLERKDIVAILDKLSRSVGRAFASYGRACFTWGQKRGSIEGNPFLALPIAAGTIQRDRVLTDAEVKKVWNAALAYDAPYGQIVRLLLLTGQRREEVSAMDWSEVSAELNTWTIPGERTKNGQPSVVPLPDAAHDILRAQLKGRRGRRRGLVFPGRGEKPFGNWSKSKAELDKACGVRSWRLHDLRRTLATGLQRLGVRLEVTEAVLNHVSGSRGGIVGVYQRHDWADEKREALKGWAAHLQAVAEDKKVDSNVVQLAANDRKKQRA